MGFFSRSEQGTNATTRKGKLVFAGSPSQLFESEFDLGSRALFVVGLSSLYPDYMSDCRHSCRHLCTNFGV